MEREADLAQLYRYREPAVVTLPFPQAGLERPATLINNLTARTADA
jgi:hypothetical protein